MSMLTKCTASATTSWPTMRVVRSVATWTKVPRWIAQLGANTGRKKEME